MCDDFDTQIQVDETTDMMFKFMAEILADCSDEELEEIFGQQIAESGEVVNCNDQFEDPRYFYEE